MVLSGTGAGGQHRNKHQNCCRITDIDSGLTANGQNHKERQSNQRDAFEKLAAMLIDHYKLKESTHVLEKSDSSVSREPRNVVIDGDLGDMIEARKLNIVK